MRDVRVDLWYGFRADPTYPEREKNRWVRGSLTSRERSAGWILRPRTRRARRCEPRSHIGAGRVNDVGCMGWNELQTRDSQAAGDFYRALFGWETEPIQDNGTLAYTTIKNAGSQNGGFMPLSEERGNAPSFWLPYFTVTSCDEAVEKVQGSGGTLFAGPMDLPAGRVAVLGDPQGAVFAVFE